DKKISYFSHFVLISSFQQPLIINRDQNTNCSINKRRPKKAATMSVIGNIFDSTIPSEPKIPAVEVPKIIFPRAIAAPIPPPPVCAPKIAALFNPISCEVNNWKSPKRILEDILLPVINEPKSPING